MPADSPTTDAYPGGLGTRFAVDCGRPLPSREGAAAIDVSQPTVRQSVAWRVRETADSELAGVSNRRHGVPDSAAGDCGRTAGGLGRHSRRAK